MSSLFQTDHNRPPEKIAVGEELLAFRVTSEQSRRALLAFEVEMPPGGGPPMLHRHDPFELYRVESEELLSLASAHSIEITRPIKGVR